MNNFAITFHNEWDQLLGEFNWITMTPINIFFERDYMIDGWMFQFVLLGLGFSIRYTSQKGFDQLKEIEKETRFEL